MQDNDHIKIQILEKRNTLIECSVLMLLLETEWAVAMEISGLLTLMLASDNNPPLLPLDCEKLF